MNDWPDRGCSLFVTAFTFAAAIYAAIDLWRMLP